MTEQSGIVTKLDADHGFYNEKNKVLDLKKKVVVVSSNGMRADLTEARVHTDKGLISSNLPALVTVPSGTVNGNRLKVDQKARLITFYNGVKTRLKPAAETAKQKVETSASGGEPQTFGDPDKPTLITSEKLVIDDNAKIATFSGAVKAAQGDASLEAPELIVKYRNDSGGSREAAAPANPDPTQSGKIESIVARSNVVLVQAASTVTSREAVFRPEARTAKLSGDVVIVSDQSRVTGDEADIDTAADTAVLTGNVVVIQEKNELRGRRLEVDRKAGTSMLTSPGEGSSPPAPISARLYQQPGGKPVSKPKGVVKSKDGPTVIGQTGFQTNPDAPIDILAEQFSSDDRTRKAVFLGAVVAKQGNVTLNSTRLIANYAGGSLAGATAAQQPGGSTQPATRITAIRAEENVTITSEADQKATGDWADFDPNRNIVTLGGKVTLIRGKQVIRGPKLVIDLTSGISRMDTGPRGAGPFPSTSMFVPGPGQLPIASNRPQMPVLKGQPTANTECPPGRMCMLLYRDDALTSGKQKKKPTPKPKSSGWSTTTSRKGE
jgi:lipopolysaccharide export system protein LptA